jgi:hypothetical protein
MNTLLNYIVQVMPDPQAHCVRPVKMNAICSIFQVNDIVRLFLIFITTLHDTMKTKGLSNKRKKGELEAISQVIRYKFLSKDKGVLILAGEEGQPPVQDLGAPDQRNDRGDRKEGSERDHFLALFDLKGQ